jgi:glycosyltransferase involved in cell wall biosynthesis
MNILVVHDKPATDMGGMSRFIARQRTLLEAGGFRITTAVCAPGAASGDHEMPATGRRTGRRAYARFDALVAESRADLIHIHSGYYAIGPWLLTRLSERYPLVYTLHDVTPLCPRTTKLTNRGERCDRTQGVRCVTSGCYPLSMGGRLPSNVYGLLMRARQLKAMRRVPSWIVPSAYLATELQRVGVAADRIHVIPHFIADPANAKAAVQAPRMLFVGRLIEEKGIKVLLQALPRLRTPQWSLHIAGEGPLRGWLEREISHGSFGDRVMLLSMLDRDALAKEYQQARVVVMPSLIPESFGLVGLEAFSFARPVVGFCSGGMAEWLRDDDTGLIADWGSSTSLAHCLDRLLSDYALCQRLGDAGYDSVRREFPPQLHLSRLRAVFEAQCAAFARSLSR